MSVLNFHFDYLHPSLTMCAFRCPAHHSIVDDHRRFQTCSLTKRLIDLLHWTQLYALSLHLRIFRLCARPNNFLHSEHVCVFSPVREHVRFQSYSLTK